jgi:uncharacterized protein YyaL (SSP411 family)
VRAYRETGDGAYADAAVKAGEWLVTVQDDDGAWRRHAYGGTAHTYYSRVAWSLATLHDIANDTKFLKACKRNVEWVILNQRSNGWFEKASFEPRNDDHPFTHTIAYTIRGILEIGEYLKRDDLCTAAERAVEGILNNMSVSGHVPGTFDSTWHGNTKFSCLTGNAQLSIILQKLHQRTRREDYLTRAKAINSYLKKRQRVDNVRESIRGAIAGSFPIWGRYIHFCYPNWATKFLADALLLERKTLLQ